MKKGTLRRLDALATDGVERADPAGPPTAFRIWKAGLNVTDHGPTVFSERSAKLLLEQQTTRGNRFPIDVDHLSLDKEAPLESRRAVGWFAIDVRDGELWAVDVEWTDTVRGGLTKEPPEWRYHSPAYDQDAETGEVVGLLNLAITNVPATHYVTALASRESSNALASRRATGNRMAEKSMKWGDIKAALEGDDEDAKATAYAAIKAAFPDEEPEKKDAKDDDDALAADKKDGEDEPEKKDAAGDPDSKDGEDEPEKKDAIEAAVQRAVNAALAPFVKKAEANERKTLLASRPDFAPELAAVLSKAPLATVRDAVAKLPRAATRPVVTTETTQATRGATQGTEGASALPADQKAKLDERMGLKPVLASVRLEGVHQIFPAMTPDEARRVLASKGVK